MRLLKKEKMIDDRNYTVTWSMGRRGNLTRQQARDLAARIKREWIGRTSPNVQVFYRDGSSVNLEESEPDGRVS